MKAIEAHVTPDAPATVTLTIADADGGERRVRCTVYDLSITAIPHTINGMARTSRHAPRPRAAA